MTPSYQDSPPAERAPAHTARRFFTAARAALVLLALATAAAHGEPLRLPTAAFRTETEDGGRIEAAQVPAAIAAADCPPADPDPALRAYCASATGRAPPGALRLAYAFERADRGLAALRIAVGNLDASGRDHLVLWIRGDAGAGFPAAIKLQFTQPDRQPGMTVTGSAVVTGIKGRWQPFRVPLNIMTGISNWRRVDELVVVIQARRGAGSAGAIEIAAPALVETGTPGPRADAPVERPARRAWDARWPGDAARNAALAARLRGWPGRALVPAAELPANDVEFLRRVALDTWRGLDALTDRDNGLPVDHVAFGDTLDPREAEVAGYTNITNVAMLAISIVGAESLGFIGPAAAEARLSGLLDTLERLPVVRGVYYNYYEVITAERGSNFLSFVDTSWLAAALMVARSAYPALAARCGRLLDRMDLSMFYDEVEELMNHGRYTHLGVPSEYHYGALYTEARLGVLIAIGKGNAPAGVWYRMHRTLPARDGWQTQPPLGRAPRTVDGHRVEGGWYQWGGLRFVPSWGGSMFEALMPMLVVDEMRWAPRSLGRNAVAHVAIQRRYATDVLRLPVWGMSPSADPRTGGYGEYGAQVLGLRGYGAGAVTPHAAVLAAMVDPGAAVSDLRRLAQRYRIYGDFGFYDAVDPIGGRVARKLLFLDQAMSLAALANVLADRALQRHFAADPIAARVLPMLARERFFERPSGTRR
ncbi:MAG: glucoamylase family protein [Gammaproteobacteria bacterium]